MFLCGASYFCKILYLRCLTLFWIRLSRYNCLIISTVTLCYALHQTLFRILGYSAVCFFRYMPTYSIILRANKAYSWIWTHLSIFRLIQACSTTCATLPYLKPCHTLSPRILRTCLKPFKTLTGHIQNPAMEHYSHNQTYSETRATLAYAEAWHTRNRGILRTLPQLHPDAY